MSDIAGLEASLGEIDKNLDIKKATLFKTLQRLIGVEEAVTRRGIDRLNKLTSITMEAILAEGNPEAMGWDSPIWDAYEPAEAATAKKIRIGSVTQIAFDGEQDPGLPSTIPLLEANGAIVVRHSGAKAEQARELIQNIVLRSALLMTNQLRFTLLDPSGMGAAFPFRGFLGRDVVRNAGRGPADELAEVVDDIRRINERVIGDADRMLSLTPEQRSGETFEIIVAAGFPEAYAKDPRSIEYLVRIANAGPRAGRHLVLEWNTDGQLPHDFDASVFGNTVEVGIDKPLHNSMSFDDVPSGKRQKELIERAFAGAKSRDGGDWNSTVRPSEFQTGSSLLRVETPLGERLKFWLGESDDGKQSAHSMIAGQVGSGKSYLLHVLITGLAARYSPDELMLTLIDGKQGVEFEAYRALPHADVVCLRTAPALARSVLSDYVDEMDRRYELFQSENVVKLSDYRAKTGLALPRCVMVVDEYQQILDGDPENGSQMLGRLLEKGRAAGMHAVLGSQTFEQRGLPTSALSHVHTWGALSLAESYSQSIQVFGQEGKRLIRDLSSVAELVLNDESGRDGANARGAVARLRSKNGEDLLPAIVKEIIGSVKPTGSAPIVLSGREGALISDNPFVTNPQSPDFTARDLQALARRPQREGGFGVEIWNANDRPLPLWFGRRFDVRGHALVSLRRAPAQNLMILGNQAEARCRMLAFGLAGLGALIQPTDLEIHFLDGLREDMPGGGMVHGGLDRLTQAGHTVHHLTEESLPDHLETLKPVTQSPDPNAPSHLLVISDPDYLYGLHAMDRFNIPSEGAPALLRYILQRGPQAGVHTIISAAGLSSFQLILSPTREATLFNHRVVQPMNEDESMTLFSSLPAARLSDRADHPFTCLYVDQQAGIRNGVLFNSYAANRALGEDQGIAAVQAKLTEIRYPKDI